MCTQYLGPGLQIEEDTILGPLADALKEDLRAWWDGLDEQTIWDRLALGLIRQERRQVTSARFHRRLAIKKQHASFLEDVANAGTHAAWLRSGPDSHSYRYLHDVACRVTALTSGLDELEMFADLRNGTLGRYYAAGNLIYQQQG